MDHTLLRLSLVVLGITVGVAAGAPTGPFTADDAPVHRGTATPGEPSRASLNGGPVSVDAVEASAGQATQFRVSLETTSGVYVLGSGTPIRGSAPPDVEAVALYVRSNDEWRLVDLNADGEPANGDRIAVGPDGRWEASDVVLSNVSDLVTMPGTYELGVIAVSDAVDENGTLRPGLSPTAFRSGRSARTSLFARPPVAAEPLVFRDIDDQVALEDATVTVRGRATGTDRVLVLVFDARGGIASEIVRVDDDETFESEFDIGRPDGGRLAEGFAVGQVVSAGRDGRVGDGELEGRLAPDLTDVESYLHARVDRARAAGSPLTQAQLLEILEAETVADSGSDDLRVVDTFAIADASNTIETVSVVNATGDAAAPIRAGDTLVVQGQTNRRPNDTTLFVEVIDPRDGRQVATNETSDWGPAGTWEVTVPTAGIEPGNYTVRVDDGEDQDRVTIRIAPARSPATPADAAPAVRPVPSGPQGATDPA